MMLLILMIFMTNGATQAAILQAPAGATDAVCQTRGKQVAAQLMGSDDKIADVQFACVSATPKQHS